MSMESEHPHGYKVYFYCWLALLGLTVLAMVVGRIDIPTGVKALFLVGLSFLKVLLIALYFMHLRFEKKNLVFITAIPLILAGILWVMLLPDTHDTNRRTLIMRDAATKAPTVTKHAPAH